MSSGSARQAANRPSANPMRLTRFRYSDGMIWSVSTLLRRSGLARPACVVKGSMVGVPSRLQVGGGGEAAGDRGGRGHLLKHQVAAETFALSALDAAAG